MPEASEIPLDLGIGTDKKENIYKELKSSVEFSKPTRFVPEIFDPQKVELTEFPSRNALRCRISSADSLVVSFTMSVAGSVGQTLFVENYTSPITGKGLGTAFYNNLEEFAVEQGFQAVAGGNSEENISFFIDKLHRNRLSELSPEKRKELIGEEIDDAHLFTYKLLTPTK